MVVRCVRSVAMFTRLDALHVTVRGSELLRRFTWAVRILLAIGFIPPGLWKVLGIPFTKIPDSNPVGLFFHGLEQATVPFPGTWVITSLMLLGVVYLLCWDWNRVKYVVYPQQ